MRLKDYLGLVMENSTPEQSPITGPSGTEDSVQTAAAAIGSKRPSLTKQLPSDRLTFDRHVAALRAFAAVFESNGGKPVSNTEAGDVVQPKKMAEGTIVVSNAFFVDIGLLSRQDDGRFGVAQEAVAFIQAEHGLSPENAPDKIKPLFEKQWFYQVIFPRVRLGPQDTSTVQKVIGEACNATKDHLVRIDILIEFLVFVRLLIREGGKLSLPQAAGQHAVALPSDKPSLHKPGATAPEIPSEEGLERYNLTLDPQTKRRIVVYAPPSVSAAELKRIQQWLSFQLIVTDPANS